MKTAPLCLASITLCAAPAFADDDREYTRALDLAGGESMSSSSVRSKVEDWSIMPGGTYELGANLSFLTTSEPMMLSDDALRFTDVVLLKAHLRTSIKGKLELFGGADLLVKQPSFTDEDVWQSAYLGARTGLGGKLTGSLQLGAGTLLGDLGYLGAGRLLVERKWSADETLWFEVAGGGAWTGLDLDAGGDPPWFAEAVASGQTIVRAPNGIAGAWVGVEFCVPVAHESGALMDLDPQTRVNFHLGAVYAIVDDLDVFAQLSILDRGDLTDPATTLPVLDGGFDQRHMIFGIIRRFPDEDSDHSRKPWMAY